MVEKEVILDRIKRGITEILGRGRNQCTIILKREGWIQKVVREFMFMYVERNCVYIVRGLRM